MSFPNLVARPGAALHSIATGVPVNGVNVFNLGLRPAVVNPDRLDLFVYALGPSVSGASIVSYDPVTDDLTVSFVQGGSDACKVEAVENHTGTW
jgi:hypothetical protein